MSPLYAIGDIHGQKAMLDQALALIAADGGPDAPIVFIGDYTDRGPNSRAVVETLIAGRTAGRDWTFIKGNHDRFFTRYVREGRQHDPRVKSGISWLNPRLGGTATLASYDLRAETAFARDPDVDLEFLTGAEINGDKLAPEALLQMARAAVPADHLHFLETLPLWHETEHLLFVHAGLQPGVALADQDVEDLLWIRDPFLESTRDHGKLVVHGHTALDHPQHHGNRVNIDGGAGYGRPLVPVVFEGRTCWTLTENGRMPLEP